MKDGCYESRAEQCKAFAREVFRKKRGVASALRSAAFVGACEERNRTLKILRESTELDASMKRYLEIQIISASIDEVLGFPEKP